jgi:PAS domain S-box-containing protein
MGRVGPTAAVTGADGRLSDAVRLRRLRDTGMLDGTAYPSLDRLARAAAHHLRAARAQVTLIDTECRAIAGSGEPPLAHSLCRLVVDHDAPLLVGDARTDERVAGHPTIGDGVVAYAGFPLRSADGYPLGAFCVIDERPREWEPRELLLIEDLAAAVEAEVGLRTAYQHSRTDAARLRAVLATAHDAYVSIDAGGLVVAWNQAAERLFGHRAEEALGRLVADLIIPERFQGAHLAGLARLHAGGPSTMAGQRVEMLGMDRSGTEFPLEMTLQIAWDGTEPVYHAFLHDISDRTADRRQLEHERTFLQALLDSLDTGVAGRLTLLNRAMRGAGPPGPDSF